MVNVDGGIAEAKRLALDWIPPLRRLAIQRDALLQQRAELKERNRNLRCKLVDAQRRLRELERKSDLPIPPLGMSHGERSLGYLFVVTYGRSGSTLLQGILNSIPGYLVRGENRSVLRHLYKYQQGLDRDRSLLYRPEQPLPTTHAWFGMDLFSSDDSLRHLRSTFIEGLLQPEQDTRVVGFKEIRWFYSDWEEYLEFIVRLFPGVRFVINSREHTSVARSKWWAQDANAMNRLEKYEAILDGMASKLGNRAYRVQYDDYVSDHGALAGLFNWLGESFDRSAIDRVMAKRHSTVKR